MRPIIWKEELYAGRVTIYWSNHPTENDKTGADGAYIERIIYKRFGLVVVLLDMLWEKISGRLWVSTT